MTVPVRNGFRLFAGPVDEPRARRAGDQTTLAPGFLRLVGVTPATPTSPRRLKPDKDRAIKVQPLPVEVRTLRARAQVDVRATDQAGSKVEPGRALRVDTEQSLREFQVTGMLGDEVVRALYEDGRLFVDGRLLTHATLLVELDEVLRIDEHGLSVQATLDGSSYAVFMTLLGACDRVISTAFDVGPDILS